jgi:CRISPR-associated exonuclease Cas4
MAMDAETWWLDVTDLKQYSCCPRLIYYRYCLPSIRPLTLAMRIGTEAHYQEQDRELRRGLSIYGLSQGERLFHYPLASARLRLKGRVDLLIVTPSRTAPNREAVVVEYKHTEQQAGPHLKIQLAAYALLVQEELHIPVRKAMLYSLALRRAETIALTPALLRRVELLLLEIRRLLAYERMPAATPQQRRCPLCEFRRFCNDVV